MGNLQVSRRQVLKGAAAAGVLGALGGPATVLADEGRRVRWDIVQFAEGCIRPGGKASAEATNPGFVTHATIVLTGSGTFPDVRNRSSRGVTGGGTWEIVASDPRCFPGQGTYRVTELLSWTLEPQGVFPPICDAVAPNARPSAGLAKLRIEYSDDDGDDGAARHGVITVSCHLGGSPDCIYEGVTASRGYEDFWRTKPSAARSG
jgi:hypothetical protein